jgi:TP901 family phage tail tape measure protein
MDFDKSMSQVAATMGKTVDEVQNLRDFAQEMGAKTAFSATQAADALNYMALAGYDADTSMQMLPNVLNLAAAGGMELASASDMITDSQSALGLTLEETSQLVDKMAQASSKANASVDQLGSAILTVGGSAKVLKGGTTELATVLGLLADNGTKGAEGGTALRNILTSLQSDKFVNFFGELGVKAYDASGNMRSLKDVFADMNRVMQGMTQQQKTDLINSVFNARDLKNVNALLATSSERWDELTAAIDDSAGAAEKMANTQLDNLAGDITLFQSALEGAKIALSDRLTPGLREFVQLGTDGLSKVTDAFRGGGLDEAMEAVGGWLSNALSVVISKVPMVVSAGAKLVVAFGKGIAENLFPVINDAIASVDWMKAGTTAMELAVSGITKGGELLMTAMGTAMSSLPDIIAQAGQLVSIGLDRLLESFWESMPRIAEGIKNGIPDLLSTMGEVVSNIMEVMWTYIPDILSQAGKLGIDFLKAAVTGLIDALPSAVGSIAEFMSSLGEMLTEAIPNVLPSVLNLIMRLSESLRENAGLLIDGAIGLIMGLAKGLIDSLPALLETIPTIVINIAGIINDNAPKLLAAGIELLGYLLMGIIKAVPTLIAEFPKIVEAIFAVITAVNWLNLGAGIIRGIDNGIKSLAASIPTAIKNIGQTAADWLSALNWKTIGADIIDLIKIGIESLMTAVPNALKSIGSKAFGVFKDIKWAQLGVEVIAGIVNGLLGGINRVIDAAKGVASGIIGVLTDRLEIHSPSRVGRWIGRMFDDGTAGGLRDGLNGVVAAAVSVADSITEPFDDIGSRGPAVRRASGGASGESDVPRGSGSERPTQVTVIMQVDKAKLGQAVFDLNKEQEEKHGSKIVQG